MLRVRWSRPFGKPVSLGVLLVSLVGGVPADGAIRPIELAEVTVRVKGADPGLRSEFRAALVDQMARAAKPVGTSWGPVLLSASVVRMDVVADEMGERTTCEVSGVVRVRKTGRVLGTLRGRAHATEAPHASDETRRAVLNAAVGRVVTAVPQVLRDAERQ